MSSQHPAALQPPAYAQQTVAVASPPSAPPLAAIDPRGFEPYACNFAEKITLGAAVCQARQVAQSHRIIGNLVHEGRCEQATKAALATGDDGYASRIHDFCLERKR